MGSTINIPVLTGELYVFQENAKLSKNCLEESEAPNCHVLLSLISFACLHNPPVKICETSDPSAFFIIPQPQTSHILISFILLSVWINPLANILTFLKSRTNLLFTSLRWEVLCKISEVTPTHLNAISSVSSLSYPGVTA